MIFIMAISVANGDFTETRAGIIRDELDRKDTECYLIAINGAQNSNLPRNHKPSLEFQAVVVVVVKGGKEVGDKIAFERVSDGGFREAKTYEGELYYLICHKIPDEVPKYGGQYHPRPDDPYTMTLYSKEASKVFSSNRKQAEQGGAGQPATATDSKSKGEEKPQPESEGRSR